MSRRLSISRMGLVRLNKNRRLQAAGSARLIPVVSVRGLDHLILLSTSKSKSDSRDNQTSSHLYVALDVPH